MTGADAQRDPVEQLAEEFLERYRRGERASITDYIQKHPELADEIREVFPALVMMEQIGPSRLAPSGACTGSMTADGRALEQLGDFRIVREVARGGMGVVFEAVQVSLGRHVAIKVLPYQASTDPIRLRRFNREARSAARLHHTNIVPVFEVGECRGTHYYAMQFIQGQGLDEVLREVRRMRGAMDGTSEREPSDQLSASLAKGLLFDQFSIPEPDPNGGQQEAAERSAARAAPRQPEAVATISPVAVFPSSRPVHPASEDAKSTATTSLVLSGQTEFSTQSHFHYFRSVARLGLQVAEALAYAHGENVMHRDIKPSNLLLDLQGRVWVTDFGLAKGEGDVLTHTGDFVGTLRYMAPERFNGVSNPRSDLYSLGITLYELLTLRPAFGEGDRGRLMKRILHEEPVRPRKIERRIPRDLETIVLKAIAKDSAHRYASGQVLVDDLRRFLSDRPIEARRILPWERAWRWCRRNPAIAVLGSFVAALLLFVAIGFQVAAMLRDERDRAIANQSQAQIAEMKAQVLLKRAQSAENALQIRAHLAQAGAIRRSGQVGQRLKALEEVEEGVRLSPTAELRSELRNQAIACLALPDLRLARQWQGWPAGTRLVDFDGSLDHYARVDHRGNLYIHSSAAGAEIGFLASSGWEPWPRFSDDGQFLARRSNDAADLWRVTDTGPIHLLNDRLSVSSVDFSPDSRLFALGHADGVLVIYDLLSTHPIHRLSAGARVHCAAFHPSKPQIALSKATGVSVYDFASEKVIADLPQPAATFHLTWNPDGKTLAAASSDGRIRLWDVALRKQLLVLEEPQSGGILTAFNHAGDLLAATGWDGMLRLWDPRTGKQLFSTQSGNGVPRFSLDDRLLACDFRGTQLGLWEVSPAPEYRTLIRDPALGKGRCFCIAVDRERGLLAAGMEDGLAFWDLLSGRSLGFISSGSVYGLLFEPSGALLANGPAGLACWPVGHERGSVRSLWIGPPESLPVAGSVNEIARNLDGQVIASAQGEGGLVFNRDQPDRSLRLGPHSDVRSIAVSPDARWIVTGSHSGTQAIVWDSRTGRAVTALPLEAGSRVGFSPDGKWLATSGGGCRLWSVGSWKPGLVIGGTDFAFSPDMRLLAVETGYGVVRLVDPDTGNEYARLEDPNHDRATRLEFGSGPWQLLVLGRDSQSIRVWDLGAIRMQLASLQLDWDLPPLPPSYLASYADPLRLTVIGVKSD